MASTNDAAAAPAATSTTAAPPAPSSAAESAPPDTDSLVQGLIREYLARSGHRDVLKVFDGERVSVGGCAGWKYMGIRGSQWLRACALVCCMANQQKAAGTTFHSRHDLVHALKIGKLAKKNKDRRTYWWLAQSSCCKGGSDHVALCYAYCCSCTLQDIARGPLQPLFQGEPCGSNEEASEAAQAT